MSTVLIASPSAFLRIGVLQQLRRRQRGLVPTEAATAHEAMRILADGAIHLAIVDDALMAQPGGGRLVATLEQRHGRALVIATCRPAGNAGSLRMISGIVDGILNVGAITRALPAALDEVAVDAGSRPARSATGFPAPIASPGAGTRRIRPELILVAASTGGPSALTLLLRHLGPPRLPVIVAQHMPADQTAGFAQFLSAESGHEVVERGAGDVLSRPQINVLRGGSDYRLARRGLGQFRLAAARVAGNVFHPSADLLFSSAVDAGVAAIAVVLSGMGEDGSRGAAAVSAHGGRVLVQDFASCVVAGMPSAARTACGTAASVASVPEIAERLSRWSKTPAPRADAELES